MKKEKGGEALYIKKQKIFEKQKQEEKRPE